VRTLVVSDLHLGSVVRRDVLRRPVALAPLVAAVARTDHLVLLGDTLELLEGRPQDAADAAEPVLRTLAGALPEGGRVTLVPGNHDHTLIRAWLAGRLAADRPLRPATQVPKGASDLLADVCSWLRPARVEVRYPGLWLADDVYAMHGHYLDRLLPAALRGRLRALEGAPRAAVEDFERAAGSDAGSVTDALAAILPDGMGENVEAAVGQARRALLAGLPALATLPGMREAASLAALTMEQGIHRRAAIPAMDEVAHRLRLRARWVIFGHIHRRGPLPGDPAALWRPRGADGPHLVNSGSWVFDSALAGAATRPSGERPYRPGGAVVLEPGRNPRVIDLLAGVPDRTLRGRV
jgi:UDP-2,3-diacylglucosamine pyrophosphatase LpxH